MGKSFKQKYGKIRAIDLSESPLLTPLIPKEYYKLCSEMDEQGVVMPSQFQMKGFEKVLWNVLRKPLTINIVFEKGQILQVVLDIGFLTDYGSIPLPLRFMVRHDLPCGVVGFLVHDLGCQSDYFGNHKKAWKLNNYILNEILRWYEAPFFYRKKIMIGVSTPIGYKAFIERESKYDIERGSMKWLIQS